MKKIDLKERLEKIKNYETDPDYNIEIANFISQKMLKKIKNRAENIQRINVVHFC